MNQEPDAGHDQQHHDGERIGAERPLDAEQADVPCRGERNLRNPVANDEFEHSAAGWRPDHGGKHGQGERQRRANRGTGEHATHDPVEPPDPEQAIDCRRGSRKSGDQPERAHLR